MLGTKPLLGGPWAKTLSRGAWESQGKACSPQRTSMAPYPRGCSSTSPDLFHPTAGLSCTKPLHTSPAHGPAHTLFAHWRYNCHHLPGTSLLPSAIPVRWPILALKVLQPGVRINPRHTGRLVTRYIRHWTYSGDPDLLPNLMETWSRR